MYATFIKKSLESIIFFIISIILAYFSKYIRNYDKSKLIFISILWKITYISTFLFIVMKYFIWMGKPVSWNARFYFYSNEYGCDRNGIYVGESK